MTVVSHRNPPRPVDLRLYLQLQAVYRNVLQLQAPTPRDTAALLDRVIRDSIPRDLGVDAWQAFLRAHATLVRRLDSDLQAKTGSGLNDFDVLAQVGTAGGSIRMTELAERVYSSRSGMTRRVDKLVADGLLCRLPAGGDGRGVVVSLTDAGVDRLAELAPAHLEAVNELFAARLDDKELAAMARMLRKVSVETTFG
jgi:DNA-binding MarR family transcriptional regulator